MIISLLAFVAVFSSVVLVHELGHFIAARRSGINVYEFSIGFPLTPRLFTLFRHKETDFTVRLLPLGGFVNFAGDGDEEARGLFEASYSNRVFVHSAGSLFNIAFGFLVINAVFMINKEFNFTDAILESSRIISEIFSGTVMLLFNIVTGQGTMAGLSGPVGIAAIAGEAASKGFMSLSYFAGILSISLGAMNLLPLPALDGGHLIMLLIESIRKRPLSLKAYQLVSLAGIAIFLILTVFITYKDVAKLLA